MSSFTFTLAEELELFPLCFEHDVSHVLRNRRMRSVRHRATEFFYPKLPPYFQKNFVQFLRNLRDVLGGSLLMSDQHCGGCVETKYSKPVDSWADELQRCCPVQLAPQASFASSLAPSLQPLTDGGALSAEFNAPYTDVVFPYDAVNTKREDTTLSSSTSAAAAAAAEKEAVAEEHQEKDDNGAADDDDDDVKDAPAAPTSSSPARAPVVPSSAWPDPGNTLVTSNAANDASEGQSPKTTCWTRRDELSGALVHCAKTFVPAPSAPENPSVVGSIAFQAKEWHPHNGLIASPSAPSVAEARKSGEDVEEAADKATSPSPARTGAAAASASAADSANPGLGARTTLAGLQSGKPPQVTAWVFHVVFRAYDEENFIRIALEPSKSAVSSPLGEKLFTSQKEQEIELCSRTISVRHCVVHRVVLLSTGHLLLTDAVRHKVFGRISIPPELVAQLGNANENGSNAPPVSAASDFSNSNSSAPSPNPSSSAAGAGADDKDMFCEALRSSSSIMENPGSPPMAPTTDSAAAVEMARIKTRQFFENVNVVFKGVAPHRPTRFMGLGIVVLDSSIHTFQHACDADCPLSWNDILYPELYSKTP